MVATPRRREGLHRRGHARLGKPGDSGGGLSCSPRRGVAHLGLPTNASGLYLWPVLGQFHGPVCDCLWLALGAIV